MKIAPEVLLWKFGSIPGNLKSENNYKNNQGYSLFCKANNKYLIWEKGMLGFNLNYASTPQTKYHFHLPDNKEREILTGEPVALANGMGEAYIHYAKQEVGINLDWSAEPRNEWRIYDETGEKGKPVATGSYYALVNVKVDPAPDFLVFLEKHMPRVVDLGWTTSPTWKDSWFNAFKSINEIRTQIM